MGRAREFRGCWHYDYEMFCVQCDPASYGPCESGCPYEHEHCHCDGSLDGHLHCVVHAEEHAACVTGEDEED